MFSNDDGISDGSKGLYVLCMQFKMFFQIVLFRITLIDFAASLSTALVCVFYPPSGRLSEYVNPYILTQTSEEN